MLQPTIFFVPATKFSRKHAHRLTVQPEDVVGSNNWALGPLKTANGYPILAGDPHLNLTLPSIWYEVHMVVPDYMDVYGVVIPGTPRDRDRL